MTDYFVGLSISCTIGLIFGIVKPKLIGNRSRLFYVLFFLALFIIASIISGITHNDKTNALTGLIGMFSVPAFLIIRNKNPKINNKEVSNNKDLTPVKANKHITESIEMPTNTEVSNTNYILKTISNSSIEKSRKSTMVSDKLINDLLSNYPTPLREPGTFGWNIMISFGKSTSQNYVKAIYLAKKSDTYGEQVENDIVTHTASFDDSRDSFLKFIVLYDLVADWKSTIFVVNGEIVDKKTIGKLKYCYGDKCRSVKSDFCFGASYMTSNPFGCHRLQVSAANNPWWGYYIQEGNHYRFDIENLIERVQRTEAAFKYCPAFDINYIKEVVKQFPLVITNKQYRYIVENINRLYIEF